MTSKPPKLSKPDYKEQLPALQWRLFDLQQAVFQQRIPVMVVLEGFEGAGQGRLAGVLAERLDPRGLRVAPITPPRTLEQQYPWLRRFWLRAPAYGQVVIFDGSWYRRVIIERLTGAARKREWQAAYADILDFEQQLAADGTVLLKYWLDLSKRRQARRFARRLADPLTAWQVDDEDAAEHDQYERFARYAAQARERTHRPHAPWQVVEAGDKYAARLEVLRSLVAALEARLGESAPPPRAHPGDSDARTNDDA
jgi:polyphosphate kinase 2 (PPK2 family)